MQLTDSNRMVQDNMLSDVLKGAVAGAIGVWVMDRLDWFAYEHEDQQARHRTDTVRPGGLDPAHVIASRAAHALGTSLSPAPPHRHPAGLAIHYAIGMGAGAAYGALRNRFPSLKTGKGSLYGAELFVVQDEAFNRIAGLSADPRKYPWQAHARGLAAHITFGMAVDATLNLINAFRRLPTHAYSSPETSVDSDEYAVAASSNIAGKALADKPAFHAGETRH